MMLAGSRNNLIAGFLCGCVLPLITWIVFEYWLQADDMIMNKPGVPYLIAICINLMMIRYSVLHDQDKTGKGIMMSTFMILLLVFMFKIRLSA
ncbi:hypothetical protein [Mucilaginibacter segetis]|uniref:Stationary phase survival protein SurE n=1 Tax=Mucilaginibacter segetis TaxID=2793071 RepID=A0A934PWT1_9SPHI|nr:hypothetical protein [Mucilaginibacter segetis]MBK0380458.1 hypothetical protein [Mucilaginibacter segetis]